jgi:hypothetical protein
MPLIVDALSLIDKFAIPAVSVSHLAVAGVVQAKLRDSLQAVVGPSRWEAGKHDIFQMMSNIALSLAAYRLLTPRMRAYSFHLSEAGIIEGKK